MTKESIEGWNRVKSHARTLTFPSILSYCDTANEVIGLLVKQSPATWTAKKQTDFISLLL